MVITKPTVDDFSDTTVMRVIRKIVEYIIDTLVPAINEGGGGEGSSYVLPPATKSTLGGIIVGDNLTVDGSGKVNAPTPYELPIGGTNIGGVKNGGNVTIDAQGNMNAPTTPAYTLPVASATTLGGVKIGNGVSVGADGTISVSGSSKNMETFVIQNVSSFVDKLKEKMPSIGDIIYFTTMEGNNTSSTSISGSNLGGTVCYIDKFNEIIVFSMSGAVQIDNSVCHPICQMYVDLNNYSLSFFYIDIQSPSTSTQRFDMTSQTSFVGRLFYIS